MKKNYSILVGLLLTASIFLMQHANAQAPQKMTFQSVLRNSSNVIIANMAVSMQFSVLQGSTSGTAVFVETQTATTNANGLVSVQIGAGTATIGTFAGIDWADGPYFIKTETDPAGGSNYTITGTQEMLSVPYVMYAEHSNDKGPQGPLGLTGATGAEGPQGLTGATGAAGTNVGVSGFTHYLGEVFNGGIIYYLYRGSDGLEHGLIVSLTQSSLAWQTSPSTLVNANRTWDGAYNTALMTGSPAATFVASLGEGWYIPSMDELAILLRNRFHANKALFLGGNTPLNSPYAGSTLGYDAYWSSNEYDGGAAGCSTVTCASRLVFSTGGFDYQGKGNAEFVRGVKAF